MESTEYSLLLRVVENLGVAGLLLFVVYKLADRWAGKFLTSFTEQSKVIVTQTGALVDLATAVRESHSEQRDLVLAVRVLATKVEATRGWVREISEQTEDRVRMELARRHDPRKEEERGDGAI
jgi:hypothetical protein